jgi:hypothetical protein
VEAAGDSLQYRVVFSDKSARDRFAVAVDRLCTEQNLTVERTVSGGNPAIKIAAAGAAVRPAQSAGVTPPAKPSVTGPRPFPDSGRPPAGSLRLYTPRSILEFPFSGLLEGHPFAEKNGSDSIPGFFTVQEVTPLSITLKLSGKITNTDGRSLNALDIVDQWTRFIHDHPAEGRALFRSCDGINDFISGREAIVRGLVPLDNATIRIKLAVPDSAALDRLRTGRALPPTLKIGPYARLSAADGDDTYASNPHPVGIRPHIGAAVIKRGGDGNALVSFSLGKYDAVALWSEPDLVYARQTLLKGGATCTPIGSDRYFIACRFADSSSRAFIRSLVAPGPLLRDAVKAEGAPIGAVENDSAPPPPVPNMLHPPASIGPVKIWYRADDAISKGIADKLMALCIQTGGQGKSIPLEHREYESVLVSGNEGCVVGWVGESVLTCRSEKLRLAAMFFNDAADEPARIALNREIPLFSVNWFLLARARVGLWDGKLSGIYVKPDSNRERER